MRLSKATIAGGMSGCPEIFDQIMPRLATFMAPFVCGLLSHLAHQNVESMAYRFGQDRLPL
jgi:hypothetical protein